jgi:two-component system, sensor histidine kinase
LAAYLHPPGSRQPDGSSRQGHANGPDLGASPSAESRASQIAAGRIGALYRSYTSRKFVIGFSTLGAILVAALCISRGAEHWQRAAIWIALVALADIGLTILDRRFQSVAPPDSELMKWGWTRAVFAGARGLAWSVGPILMYTEDETVTLIVPVWGIINLMAASAYTASPFFPCLLATIIGGILPAATWLAFQQAQAAHLAALLLVLSVPFIAFIGMLGRRNIGALISGRLELAEILDRQKQQTQIVEQALAERTRFFSAASHDLRQPLQALGFYTSLLATKSADDNYAEIVNRLEECASILEQQFNSILGIAEIDSAVNRARVIATPLKRIFQRVAVSIRPEAELKKLRVRIAPTSLWVMAAPELLERVLVNLVANAVRYTTHGGVLIGARPRGNNAELWVVDTGIGISQQHHQNIFDEFYQVGNPARAPDQGFGLGLATVRRLCTGMRWPLDFRSVVNKGSCFRVTVPITAPLVAGPPPESVQPRMPGGTSKVAVVVVDDDPLVRDAMERLIGSWGFRVETCRSGDQAVEILKGRDLSYRWAALIDYRLGDFENGFDVTDRVRATFGPSIGVTLMTAESDNSIFEQAAQRAMVVLRKPIKPIRLRAILTTSAKEDSTWRDVV